MTDFVSSKFKTLVIMAQNYSNAFSPSLTNLSDASDRILKSTIETLTALKLENIDNDWVEDIWRSQVSL